MSTGENNIQEHARHLAEVALSERETWNPPEVFSAAELCARPDPPQEELLSAKSTSDYGPLLVAGSRLVVGGYTGEGKTTLAIEIVKAVSSASDFLDWKGAGERCLMIDLEQGERSAKKKLRNAGLGDSQGVDYVLIPDGMDLGDPEHADWIEQIIEDGGYRLVVVDPLYKLHRGDANEERSMTDLMRRIDGLRARHNFALVIPMHLRKRSNDPKAGSDVGIGEIQGSGSLTWGAEVVVALRRQKSVDPVTGAHRNSLYWLKDRDGELPPIHTEWVLTWTKSGGFKRAADIENKTVKAQIKELLARSAGVWVTQEELAGQVVAQSGNNRGKKGITGRAIRDAIASIREEGLADGLGDLIMEQANPKKQYMVQTGSALADGQPAVNDPVPTTFDIDEAF